MLDKMTRYFNAKYLLYFVLISLIIANSKLAEGKEEADSDITVIGTGIVINENEAAARKEAISDAQAKGMEEYLERSLGRQGMINNFQAIINEIIPNYDDFIEKINYLTENRYKNRYKILASIKINEKLMEERLKDLGIIIMEGLPIRLLFLVSQKIPPEEDVIYWWSDPILNNQLSTTELILHRLFQERGLRPVNRLSSVPEDYSDEIRKLYLTDEDIVTWGRLYAANAVIFGRVELTDEGAVLAELSVMDVERNSVIGQHSETLIPDEAVADVEENPMDTLEKALNNAINALIPNIVTAFKDEELIKNNLRIRLTGLDNFKQLEVFNEFLLNDVKGVESVIQTRIKGDILTVEAEFTGKTELFISRIKESLKFPFPADVRVNEEGIITVELKKRSLDDSP